MLAVAACGSSPAAPSSPLTVSIADPLTARTVVCSSCSEPPFIWAVAEFEVRVTDASGQGGTIAFVEAVVHDRTRAVELGRGRRPNAEAGLDVSVIPAGGAVTTPMGVRLDLPPPRDDVQITISVALTSGRTATATARLVVQ
jgi:hypothetical protein